MALKQKTYDHDEPDDKSESKMGDDVGLKSKVSKAKEVLDRLTKAAAKPKGHYEECCGVRRWVPD
jgi:hypothetical protein